MAAASGRARSCSRSARTTSTTRRSCSPSSTAPRRPSSPREAAAALEEAGRRALARESNRSGAQAAPALGRARADARAPLPRRPRGVAPERPAGGLGRDDAACSTRRARQATATIEGKALTALAEVALLREGDLPKATELIDAALEALPDGRALRGARGARAGSPGGSATSRRRSAGRRGGAGDRPPARAQGPRGARARRSWPGVTATSSASTRPRNCCGAGSQLAEESGSIVARAQALHSLGLLKLDRSETVERRASCSRRREPSSPRSAAHWMLGRTLNALAWAAEQQEDDAEGRAAAARGDPPAEAARGPRRALREPARSSPRC